MGDQHGRVVGFDPQRGLGTVEAAGGARYRFHCTRIVDGLRDIAVDAEVTFRVVPGHHGGWEADAVRPST
jgi:cold shock CspA family protein